MVSHGDTQGVQAASHSLSSHCLELGCIFDAAEFETPQMEIRRPPWPTHPLNSVYLDGGRCQRIQPAPTPIAPHSGRWSFGFAVRVAR